MPLRIRRGDTGAEVTLAAGADPVVVSGPPAELVLFLFGREQTRDLTFDGPPEAVAKVRNAEFGV